VRVPLCVVSWPLNYVPAGSNKLLSQEEQDVAPVHQQQIKISYCIWGQNHVWFPEIGASGVFWPTHDSAEGGTSSTGARDCRRIWIHKWRSAFHCPDERVKVWHFLTTNASFCRRRTWRKLCLNRMSERSWSIWITTCRRYYGSQTDVGTRISKRHSSGAPFLTLSQAGAPAVEGAFSHSALWTAC
jgi:hypothetical protein